MVNLVAFKNLPYQSFFNPLIVFSRSRISPFHPFHFIVMRFAFKGDLSDAPKPQNPHKT